MVDATVADGLPAPGPLRPRLRGWLHQVAFLVSIPLGVVVVAIAHGHRLAAAIYSVTLAAMLGTSALYHRLTWSPAKRRVMKRLDHSMIFLFIAGTYTPCAVTALSPTAGAVILTVVWVGAALGITLRMVWLSSPRWLVIPLYIALGWVAPFVFPQLLRNAGVVPFVLLLAGGVAYSLGAVVYAARRPDPWPATFGYHEVYHACTVVAALCHYVAVVWIVR